MSAKRCEKCGMPIAQPERVCSLCRIRIAKKSRPQGSALFGSPARGTKEDLSASRDPEEDLES